MKKYFILFIIIIGCSHPEKKAGDGQVILPDSLRMQQVYEKVKTPYKYGVVLKGDEGAPVDCPGVFRHRGSWYMVYICMNKKGYETHIAKSSDLLNWQPLGKILPFSLEGKWDASQAAGYVALQNTRWGGDAKLRKYKGRYWMSYLGGMLEGYETDPLAIGIASAKNPSKAEPWERYPEPVLTRDQDDCRYWESLTQYKSNVIYDSRKTLGKPFVMFYNGKAESGYERIGMAVSDDMVKWKRLGNDPVIDNGSGISGDPQIVRIDDLWVMFYFGAFWKPKAFDTFACSYDLVHWKKWNGPHLVEPSESFDSEYAHKPWVISHDGVIYHFYCAVGDQGRVIALATSKDLKKKVDNAPGFPERGDDLDVLPGFKNPPAGYGEVPFWWWTGDSLNTGRMISQIKELHRKGISGVQVNYSHLDSPGWLTDSDYPAPFSEEWWKVYSTISKECSKLGMGIGMSTYTIDWPQGANNLFYRLFYRKPELNAFELQYGTRKRVRGGKLVTVNLQPDSIPLKSGSGESGTGSSLIQRIAVRAYPISEDMPHKGSISLDSLVTSDKLKWTPPGGDWEIWEFLSVRKPGSLNPLMAGSGDTVLNGFFRKFEEKAGSHEGLNYFFNDELQVGAGPFGWNPDFAAEFFKRKGYDLFDALPGMWTDIGDFTPKIKMDYADVRMSLMEERYFKPVYQWHNDRGMIYGCDSQTRGLDPSEFGDYFRATRWYTSPGHDTPGGKADPMKGKVSSSIANLYQRPRVWLEGYHSLGWGATPEQLMFATRENFLYGCTLLNLHGFYYTTYGSFWEWAPPCYHFRMPYWNHMDAFLKYFERLSYLLSQGHLVCDVAIVYPVAPYEAGMDGGKSVKAAFELGRRLIREGVNFEFIDNESLARAVVEDGRLKVKNARAEYKVLVFPEMDAVRWQSIEKAAEFSRGGGKVLLLGMTPSASDHAGRNDPALQKLNDIAFLPDSRVKSADQAVESIKHSFVPDVQTTGKVIRSLHRKSGFRDVYMVMDASPGTVAEFRCKGAAELWDPWTGNVSPLRVTGETSTGTKVELPLEEYEASIVVFTPGKKHINPPEKDTTRFREILLPEEWQVSFVPTMDNTYGDFRLPVTKDNMMIGTEARRFSWCVDNNSISQTAMLPDFNDSQWEKKLNGYGPQFYILGPVPGDIDPADIESKLSKIINIDPSVPVIIGDQAFTWKPYDFSWRFGKEGNQGHQGYHGLKKTVSDDFLCLGKPERGLNETRYTEEISGGRYYLWSCVTVGEEVKAEILFKKEPSDKSQTSPELIPSEIFVNGSLKDDTSEKLSLQKGANTLLVRYDNAGRGFLVVRKAGAPQPEFKQPLSMRWYNDKGIIPFDIYAGKRNAEWFRFRTVPGTTAFKMVARGVAEAWIDGERMINERGRFVAAKAPVGSSVVAIKIIPETSGISGGSLIPDEITVETNGKGIMKTGDWSAYGILNNYSGGVRYTVNLRLEGYYSGKEAILDLGKVAGTAEVTVNGKNAGIRVAPPWRTDVSGCLKNGNNKIEILVYNTLSNHYQTIPSGYRGNPVSGLLGPVKLLIKSGILKEI